MTVEEAKRLLQLHSGREMDSDPEKWEHGFLVPLRARADEVNESNFLEIIECIKAVAHEIASKSTVDRELMAALWGLIFLPRYWAFNPRALEAGIRNGHRKLDGEKLAILADQLDRIAEAVDYALNGMADSVDDAMVDYGKPLPNYFAAVSKHTEQGASADGGRDTGSS